MSFGAAGGYGMAAQAIGNELQGWAAVYAQKAMERAFADSLARGQYFSNRARGVVGKNINQQTAAQFDLWRKAGTQNRMDLYGKLAGVSLGTPPASLPSLQRERALSTLLAATRANLLGYDDAAFKRSLGDQETQRRLAYIIDAAQGQTAIDPYRFYEAQHSMDKLKMAGESISSLGGAAANYSQYLNAPQQQQQRSATPSFVDAYGTLWPTGWSSISGNSGMIPG